MAFITALEFLLVIAILVIGVTQIVIPLFGDRRWFPMFRAPGKAVEHRADAEEQAKAAEIERQATAARAATDNATDNTKEGA